MHDLCRTITSSKQYRKTNALVDDIPEHAIKQAGCCRLSDDFSRIFDPCSDEPEAEQKRPLVLIIDLAQVDHQSLIKILRQRTDKTPIVLAIARDSEIIVPN